MTDVGPSDTEDAALLAAVADGDERAFETFYRRYLPAITGFHLRRTRRRETAFDLTAETFAAVIVACGSYDPARGSATGWLFGIAANKLRQSVRRGRVEDAARRRLGHAPVLIDDEDLARVDELATVGDESSVTALLAGLPAEQREAITARVVDERGYDEIAAELCCSEAVVRQRVHRGLRRLRQRLEEST
jgi:RNA polymerase sigma factor (sigma-70 family)